MFDLFSRLETKHFTCGHGRKVSVLSLDHFHCSIKQTEGASERKVLGRSDLISTVL